MPCTAPSAPLPAASLRPTCHPSLPNGTQDRTAQLKAAIAAAHGRCAELREARNAAALAFAEERCGGDGGGGDGGGGGGGGLEGDAAQPAAMDAEEKEGEPAE